MQAEERTRLLATLKSAAGGKEALFRPSATPRWIKCPGSVWMGTRAAPKIVQASNIFADEGTAAHAVVADALEGRRQPEEWIDRAIKAFPDRPEKGWIVDEEMATCANFYLDVVESRKTPATIIYVEHKLSLQPLDPTDPLLAENTGTGDCVLIDRQARKATIIDLKYGKGVTVSGDTPQLKDYGLMTLATFAPLVQDIGGWAEVETVIVQPRISGTQQVKAVVYDPFDLMMDFAGVLVGAMEEGLRPDAALVPGDHCRWCPGAAICPALQDRAVNIGRDAFAAVPMLTAQSPRPPATVTIHVGDAATPRPVATAGSAVLPAPSSLDMAEIATILERESVYDAWISAIKHRAVQMLECGAPVPGWCLEARSGNRRWIDVDKAKTELIRLGVTEDKLYAPPKMVSPAQAEKLLPGPKKTLIADLVEKPLGAATLTRTSASKQPLAPKMGAIPQDQR